MASVESIFTQGRLEMSAVPLPGPESTVPWGTPLTDRIAVILAVALVLAALKDIIRLTPTLVYALDRTSGSIGLESNLSMARMRDSVALSFILPFCLTVDRFSVYRPFPGQDIPPEWSFAAVIGVLLAFLALRRLCHKAVHIPKLGPNSRSAVLHGLYNFFIALCATIVPLACILTAFRLDDNVIRTVITAAAALAYILFLIRAGEIFLKDGRSALQTILYLCALEILPAALVAASAAIL